MLNTPCNDLHFTSSPYGILEASIVIEVSELLGNIFDLGLFNLGHTDL